MLKIYGKIGVRSQNSGEKNRSQNSGVRIQELGEKQNEGRDYVADITDESWELSDKLSVIKTNDFGFSEQLIRCYD